jgi:hypothetical protein
LTTRDRKDEPQVTTTSSSFGSPLLVGIGILVILLLILYSVIASAVTRGVREGILLASEDARADTARPPVEAGAEDQAARGGTSPS